MEVNYTYEKLKGWYVFKWFSMFIDSECERRAESLPDDIYSLCGTDADGKVLCMLTYYSNDDNAPEKNVSVDFSRSGEFEIYRLDGETDGELTEVTTAPVLSLKVNTCVLIKEKL